MLCNELANCTELFLDSPNAHARKGKQNVNTTAMSKGAAKTQCHGGTTDKKLLKGGCECKQKGIACCTEVNGT